MSLKRTWFTNPRERFAICWYSCQHLKKDKLPTWKDKVSVQCVHYLYQMLGKFSNKSRFRKLQGCPGGNQSMLQTVNDSMKKSLYEQISNYIHLHEHMDNLLNIIAVIVPSSLILGAFRVRMLTIALTIITLSNPPCSAYALSNDTDGKNSDGDEGTVCAEMPTFLPNPGCNSFCQPLIIRHQRKFTFTH